MAGRLSSKVVIVTGGSTGIGRAVAGRVVAEGGAVVIAGRRREPGERAAAGLRTTPPRHCPGWTPEPGTRTWHRT